MVAFFIIVVLSLFVLIILKKFKDGLFFIFFLIPFTPRYLAFGLGSEGFSLSLQRLLLILLFFFTLLLINNNGIKKSLDFWKENWKILQVALLLFFIKFFSTLVNSGIDFSNQFQVVNEFLLTINILIILPVFINNINDIGILLKVIFFSLFLTQIFVVFEYFKDSPLLSGLIEVQIETNENNILEGKIRNQSYRVMGLFENPLVLVEMILITLPFGFYLRKTRAISRIIFYTFLILLPFTLYWAGSRSGIFIFILLIILHWWLKIYSRSRAGTKFSYLMLSLFIVVAVFFVMTDIGSDYYIESLNSYDPMDRSFVERVSQFWVVGKIILENPFIGFGFLRNYARALEDINKLDNYYLRLGLEAGIIGIFLFLKLQYLVARKALIGWSISIGLNKILWESLLVSIISFFLCKFILSMPFNNIYFYVFLVIIAKLYKYQTNRLSELGNHIN